MSQTQRHLGFDDPLDAIASSSDDSAASIDAWLNVVSRLMHLPEPAKREICSELREHLRERVRDLLLIRGAGSDERDALRQAIDELGETAQLARRFEAANRPRIRRTVMNAMLMLVGAGAVAAGVMTFSQNNASGPMTPVARYKAAEAVAPPSKSLEEARCTLKSDASLRDALESVIASAKVGLMVDWTQMEKSGIDASQPLGLSFSDMSATNALALIAQAGSSDVIVLDWRMRENNLVEFGERNALDRREIELVTYDISESVARIASGYTDDQSAASEQVMRLLTTMVEPDNWRDNGGDLAHMTFVGGRLFVQAPSRMQERVMWILDQLPNKPAEQSNAGPQAAPVRRVLNPGDTVTVSVFELYQPNAWSTTTRQIDEIGQYRVAEVGDVRAAGQTIDEFTAEVQRQFQAKVMPIKPKVDVSLDNGVAAR